MAFKVRLEGDKYRVIDATTGEVALNTKTGTPLDGGGHDLNHVDRADRQAGHLNAWVEKQQADE